MIPLGTMPALTMAHEMYSNSKSKAQTNSKGAFLSVNPKTDFRSKNGFPGTLKYPYTNHLSLKMA